MESVEERVKLKPYSANIILVDISHHPVFILKNVSESVLAPSSGKNYSG
jgi:hypothetical protein